MEFIHRNLSVKDFPGCSKGCSAILINKNPASPGFEHAGHQCPSYRLQVKRWLLQVQFSWLQIIAPLQASKAAPVTSLCRFAPCYSSGPLQIASHWVLTPIQSSRNCNCLLTLHTASLTYICQDIAELISDREMYILYAQIARARISLPKSNRPLYADILPGETYSRKLVFLWILILSLSSLLFHL